MRKEEQRAPLLNQDELETIARGCVHFQGSEDAMNAAYKIRDWYEAKITNGALMVPKICSLSNVSMLLSNPPWYKYHCCGRKYLEPLEVGEFCRCGAKIIA